MTELQYARFVALGARPKIAFLGSPHEAAIVLQALIDSDLLPVVVLTNPPSRRGRGSTVSQTPVGQVALANNLPVIHNLDELHSYKFDLGVVVAFGKILRTSSLDLAPYVNVHFSILPRWRGAAPVERAIMALDKIIGVSLMEVGPGLDEGAIFDFVEVGIESKETASALRERLAHIGAGMLVSHLIQGGSSFSEPKKQEGQVTYAAKLTRADLRVDFSMSASAIDAVARVGGAWAILNGKRIKILAVDIATEAALASGVSCASLGCVVDAFVRCSDGYVELLRVQPEGKLPMAGRDWLRGLRSGSTELAFEAV